MKVCSIAYVPPPTWGCSRVFLANLRKFKTAHDLVLFSDWDYGPDVIRIRNPELIDGRDLNPKWAVNNAVWFTGMKIASVNGYTHAIYLESDCRVGCDGWDGKMFDEYFNLPLPVVCAGTLTCWNPFNSGLEAGRRWEQMVAETNTKRNFPIATYGVRQSGPCSIFPLGALGIYDLLWISKLFDLNDAAAVVRGGPWDFEVGTRIWRAFGLDSFEVVGFLNSIYSGYGEEVTTESERLKMLRDGKVCATHQVKSQETV